MHQAVIQQAFRTVPDISGVNGGYGTQTSRGNAGIARLVQLRRRGLDVVFVIDATGSMGWVLTDVTMQVREIADALRSLVPLTRIGVAVFQGAETPHLPVRLQPLTYSTTEVELFLSGLGASGGGGLYKDIAGGIKAAVRSAGWRKTSQAIIVLVADGPPPNNALSAIRKAVRAFARQGGSLVVVDASGQANPAMVESEIGRSVNYAMYSRAPTYSLQRIAEAANTNATTLQGNLNLSQALVGRVLGINPKPLFDVVKMRFRLSPLYGRPSGRVTKPNPSVVQEGTVSDTAALRQLTDQMAVRAQAASAGLLRPSEIRQSIADVHWILRESHRRQRTLEMAIGNDEHALKALYESTAWQNISYAYDWLPCWLGWLMLAERHMGATNNATILRSAQSAFRAGQIRVWRPELVVQSSRGLARVALAEHKPLDALRILRTARARYATRISGRARRSLDKDINLLHAPIISVSTVHQTKPEISAVELADINDLIQQQLRFGSGAAQAAPLIRGLLQSGEWDVRLVHIVLRAKLALADQDIGVLGDLAVAEEALKNKHYYSAVESYARFFQSVYDARDRGLARYRYRYGLACLEAGLNGRALQVTDDLSRRWKLNNDVESAVLKLRFLASYARAREIPSPDAIALLRDCAAAFLADAPNDPDAGLARLALAHTSQLRVAPRNNVTSENRNQRRGHRSSNSAVMTAST